MTLQRKQTTLDNGIVVLTDTAAPFQSVALSLTFRVRAYHEPEDRAGLAHMLEHICFCGCTRRSSDEVQAEFGRLGDYFNGATHRDRTVYCSVVVKDNAADALAILSELICDPKLAKDDLKLEQDIVEQESCNGCYNCTLREAQMAQTYPDQKMQHPVIGYDDTMKEITVDDLRPFHRQYYVGQNLIVSIAADVDHDEVVEMIRAALGHMPAAQAATFAKLEFQPGDMVMGRSSDSGGLRLT